MSLTAVKGKHIIIFICTVEFYNTVLECIKLF
jgi:hypothetical protein